MDIRSGLQPVWVWAGVYFGETQNRLCINQRAVGPFLCKQQAVVCENCFVFLVILLALAVAQKLASLNELQHQVCVSTASFEPASSGVWTAASTSVTVSAQLNVASCCQVLVQ